MAVKIEQVGGSIKGNSADTGAIFEADNGQKFVIYTDATRVDTLILKELYADGASNPIFFNSIIDAVDCMRDYLVNDEALLSRFYEYAKTYGGTVHHARIAMLQGERQILWEHKNTQYEGTRNTGLGSLGFLGKWEKKEL